MSGAKKEEGRLDVEFEYHDEPGCAKGPHADVTLYADTNALVALQHLIESALVHTKPLYETTFFDEDGEGYHVIVEEIE